MMLPWLSDTEVEALTKKKRPSAQIKVLVSMRIDHRVRPDGSIVVLTSALNQQPKPVKARKEPNMSAI